MKIMPDHIAVATGSAGTLAGLLIGKHLFNFPGCITAFCVSNDAPYFQEETANILQEFHENYGGVPVFFAKKCVCKLDRVQFRFTADGFSPII